MKILATIIISLMAIFFVACGGAAEKPAKTDDKADKTKAEKPKEEKKETSDDKLATPKDSIAYQFELVKKGDAETLKNCCFTDRTKAKITKEIVDKAKGDASKYKMEDLFDKVEEGEFEGKKTAKVKMKNGKTLTTLIETDGKWLADTVWFN